MIGRGFGQTTPGNCVVTSDGNTVCVTGSTGGAEGASLPLLSQYMVGPYTSNPLATSALLAPSVVVAAPSPSGPVDCSNVWKFITNPSTCWKLPSLPNCNTFLGTGALGQMLCGGNAYWIWLGLAGIGVLILLQLRGGRR